MRQSEGFKIADRKQDFMQMMGIDEGLSEFLNEFLSAPDIFYQMSSEKRIKLEKQIDTILEKFDS